MVVSRPEGLNMACSRRNGHGDRPLLCRSFTCRGGGGATMNKTTRALIGLITVTGGLRAQDTSGGQARRTTVGVEIDVLPYILSGYYGSLWVGRGQWRARAVVSRT